MTAEQRKENRQYYLSGGRCPRCGGKNKVVEGRVLCAECQKKHDEGQKERRDRWRAEGRCIRCGRERAEGRYQCQMCLDKRAAGGINANAARAWRNSKISAGKCVRCGIRYAACGHKMCEKCLKLHKADCKKYDPYGRKAKARRDERAANGLCIDCGKPTNGKRRCESCLAARRDSNRKYQILKRMDKEAEKARLNNGQA